MNSKYWNSFLALIFFTLVVVGYMFASHYKETQKERNKEAHFAKIANSFSNKLDILIQEKKNATLTIGLALSEDNSLKSAILKKENIYKELAQFSKKLKESTDFKNVWIQLVDAKGDVVSRSWSKESGDNLKNVKTDVSKMIMNPQVMTGISTGKYDLCFRSMIPFFDEKNHFIGYLELITHFNSLAKKLASEGLESVVLVDKSYKNQIRHPFTELFIGDYYVANLNANKKIMKYIKKIGVDKAVSYQSKYFLTNDKEYLRVNYTLFDSNLKPMAYILMFQSLNHIDLKSLKNEDFLVDIVFIFIVSVVGFLLSLFIKKEQTSRQKIERILKHIALFFILFISLVGLFYFLLDTYKTKQKTEYLQSYNANIEKDYEIIDRKFEIVAETMFETVLHNSSVNAVMQEAYTEKKDQARERLYRLLKAKYEYYNDYDVRQLHFHLKNNESFLRFHRPNKYGDNLTDIRDTVTWVNTHGKKIKGFEEGRIYNGFRYVFPLSSEEKEHLGSVEVSFSAHAIASEFIVVHDAKAAFLISKDVVNTKLFDEEKLNYTESEFENFYYDTLIQETLKKSFKHINIEKISQKNRKIISEHLQKGKVFTIASEDEKTLFSIVPLRNAVSKEVVAALIIETKSSVLKQASDLFELVFLAGTILILLTTIFIYREYTLKLEFLELSSQTREILDMQKSMIVILDKEKIVDVNTKLLEFFGYKELGDFHLSHSCISDIFMKDDNYFHKEKVPQNISWIEYFKELPHKERVVLLEDFQGIKHSFILTASSYNAEHYILNFTDISETMQEQFALESKMLRDKLTGAYNREFFESKYHEILSSAKAKEKMLGIMFFDVDHFKQVNDTYGHGVGDAVLKELARKVTESIRSNDYLIRWGGEEFVIFLETDTIENLEAVAQNLRVVIQNHDFSDVESISCSFGVTIVKDSEAISTALERADKALYISKRNGRNMVSKLY